MRKNLVLLFGAILLLPFLFGSASNVQTKNDQVLIIRVSSADPAESLSFEGCYLFTLGDQRFETVKRSTPFETQASSQYVAAIFHKTSGKAQVCVQLITSVGGEEHLNVAGTSSDVILTTDTRTKPFTHRIQTTE